MKQLPRDCRRCGGPQPWLKVRVPGAVRSRFACVVCGGPTHKIKRRRDRATRQPHLKLRDRADALWRMLILAKAPDGCCSRCDKKRPLQACHNVGRGKCLALRHDPDNGLPCCAGCHQTIDQVAEEKRGLFLRHLGEARYARLELIRQARARVDMKLVILDLEQKVRGIA